MLLHCNKGNEITFGVLMYLANVTKQDAGYHNKYKPKITSTDVYNISAAMGYDFLDNMQMEVVWSMTGEDIPKNPTRYGPQFSVWTDNASK
jgi:hypothetical protein